MSPDSLCTKVASGGVAVLTAAEWDELAPSFAVLQRDDTLVSGDILVAEGPCGIVVVEQPRPEERAVRAAKDVETARAFVADRLATYDRMWNGCGCKVDYYH